MNEYMFDSSAQIATLGADTSADSGTGQMTGKGSVNVFIADHGQVLQMISNLVQQTHTATGGDAAHMGVFDFSYLRSGMLHGYRSEPQGRTGLSTKDQLSVDWTTKVLSEPSQGFIGDLQPDGTWTST